MRSYFILYLCAWWYCDQLLTVVFVSSQLPIMKVKYSSLLTYQLILNYNMEIWPSVRNISIKRKFYFRHITLFTQPLCTAVNFSDFSMFIWRAIRCADEYQLIQWMIFIWKTPILLSILQEIINNCVDIPGYIWSVIITRKAPIIFSMWFPVLYNIQNIIIHNIRLILIIVKLGSCSNL